MLRASVVGTSCSGKTTISRRIAADHGISHIELDAIFWQPNWTPLPLDQYRLAVQTYVEGESWVIDGNYRKVREIVWARATDVIWMNPPLATVLWRVMWRTAKRVVKREELFAGNRETLGKALFSSESLIWWVIRTHQGRIRALRGELATEQYSHLKLHEIKNPGEARLLSQVGFGAG